MKAKFFGILVSVMLLMLTFSAAAAAGPTVGQLENAGWFCFDPDGPEGPFGRAGYGKGGFLRTHPIFDKQLEAIPDPERVGTG